MLLSLFICPFFPLFFFICPFFPLFYTYFFTYLFSWECVTLLQISGKYLDTVKDNNSPVFSWYPSTYSHIFFSPHMFYTCPELCTGSCTRWVQHTWRWNAWSQQLYCTHPVKQNYTNSNFFSWTSLQFKKLADLLVLHR